MNHPGLLQISRETGLPVKKILEMLFILLKSGEIENNELVRKLGVSRNVLNQIKQSLAGFFEPSSAKTKLSEKGIKFSQELFKEKFFLEEQIWDVLKNNDFKAIVSLLEQHELLYPQSKREYDQFTATRETTALRACLMNFFEDLKGKRILFLGDDDFTSISASHFQSAKEVAVLDIDERILGAIGKIAKEKGFNIKTFKHDVRQKLPADCIGKFDVVFTDPPYTPNGVKLFLSRAIQALDSENKAGRIYLCYGNSDRAKERFLSIYKLLADSGLMVRWVFDKFNRYSGAESIGSTSSLFVCELTPQTKPLIKGEFNEEIYTKN